jgi:ribosome-associated toxin RatA of RatAB toxin-antitoxin module
MPTVRKSVIVARPREALFALVERCEDYPRFLPWCSAAEVFERDERVTRARICIDYHGLQSHIETRNVKEAPERIALEFVDGPFREFHGVWTFAALGTEGCRVELALDYAFANRALEAMLGPVFGHIVETLVDRFVARAESAA